MSSSAEAEEEFVLVAPHDQDEQQGEQEEEDRGGEDSQASCSSLPEDSEVEVCFQEEDEEDSDDAGAVDSSLLELHREVSALHRSASAHGDLSPSSWSTMAEEDRLRAVLARVEDAVEEQMDRLMREGEGGDGGGPAFVYPNLSSWNNVCFCPRRGLVPCTEVS